MTHRHILAVLALVRPTPVPSSSGGHTADATTGPNDPYNVHCGVEL